MKFSLAARFIRVKTPKRCFHHLINSSRKVAESRKREKVNFIGRRQNEIQIKANLERVQI